MSEKEVTMRVKLSEEELLAIVHALREEKDKIFAKGGNQYGLLTLDELGELIFKLENDNLDPIKAYIEGLCPQCYIKIIDSYCPECGEKWNGDEVLSQFY